VKQRDSHLSDEQLLLDIEGELLAADLEGIEAHLHGCWTCRTRRQALEAAITDFVHLQRRQFEGKLPPAEGPRALLKARLMQLSSTEPSSRPNRFLIPRWLGPMAAILALLVFGLFIASLRIQRAHHPAAEAGVVSMPDSRLTPGATVLVSRPAVCAQPDTKNKIVPVTLQRQVFQEYGIPGADPHGYEVDYLITPALGGADDIRNLWPHSYSAVWNAQVKDALEDRLREMVCGGQLDLTEAQRDLATNWIAAYKKYFHAERPQAEHTR
jgi:hypothetical protein